MSKSIRKRLWAPAVGKKPTVIKNLHLARIMAEGVVLGEPEFQVHTIRLKGTVSMIAGDGMISPWTIINLSDVTGGHMNYYRITTDTDAVHWYYAENEQDAKEQHWGIQDPHGTDIADARIFGIREGAKWECGNECYDEQSLIWATCWCEEQFELQPGGEDYDEMEPVLKRTDKEKEPFTDSLITNYGQKCAKRNRPDGGECPDFEECEE